MSSHQNSFRTRQLAIKLTIPSFRPWTDGEAIVSPEFEAKWLCPSLNIKSLRCVQPDMIYASLSYRTPFYPQPTPGTGPGTHILYKGSQRCLRSKLFVGSNTLKAKCKWKTRKCLIDIHKCHYLLNVECIQILQHLNAICRLDFLALPCTINCETWETMTNHKINELLGASHFKSKIIKVLWSSFIAKK